MKIKSSQKGEITLSFTDMSKSCLNRIFYIANMSFNPIRENKILAKIFAFTVFYWNITLELTFLVLLTQSLAVILFSRPEQNQTMYFHLQQICERGQFEEYLNILFSGAKTFVAIWKGAF